MSSARTVHHQCWIQAFKLPLWEIALFLSTFLTIPSKVRESPPPGGVQALWRCGAEGHGWWVWAGFGPGDHSCLFQSKWFNDSQVFFWCGPFLREVNCLTAMTQPLEPIGLGRVHHSTLVPWEWSLCPQAESCLQLLRVAKRQLVTSPCRAAISCMQVIKATTASLLTLCWFKKYILNLIPSSL